MVKTIRYRTREKWSFFKVSQIEQLALALASGLGYKGKIYPTEKGVVAIAYQGRAYQGRMRLFSIEHEKLHPNERYKSGYKIIPEEDIKISDSLVRRAKKLAR